MYTCDAGDAATSCTVEVYELPVNIVKPLQDTTALEKSRVILDCTVSNPRCSIRWYKGSNVILPSERFEICSEGCYRKLILQHVALEDDGTYSVQVGDYTCSAKLTPSSCIRLEKMGTVHRLTLRQTTPDMSGVVEFASGKAKSQAQLRVVDLRCAAEPLQP
ncbi:hypothetical protein GOODEAATRI_013963 [Goodea atripinnis]|uniref:Ig-like domain-containing protein n=1 Tax=Goodea atripinnis TaxID=208336 RepID=A0ABV0N2K3_9TELE